jgi:hypothetical protein
VNGAQAVVYPSVFQAANSSGLAGQRKPGCNRGPRAPSRGKPSMAAASRSRRYAPRKPPRRPGKPPVRPTAPRPRPWSLRMEGYGGPAQPSPTIAQCLNGGLAWLEVEGNRCRTRASLPLDAIRRRRDTPLWKLEASLKCRPAERGLRPTWHSYCRRTRRSGSRRILFAGSPKGAGQFSDIL